MKKRVRLTAILLSLLMCGTAALASCDEKDKTKESTEQTQSESELTEKIQIEGSYQICYTSNGDGTCYVSDICFLGNVEDLTVELPATSPMGERVVAYSTNALTHPELPRMLLPADFEALIDVPMKQAAERGEISEFMYRKVLSCFERKNLEGVQDEALKAEALVHSPVLAFTDLYVLVNDLSPAEWEGLSEYIEKYTDYSPTKGISAANRLITLCEQNKISTSWIKSPVDPAEIKGIQFPESLTKIAQNSFCGGDALTEVENGVSYVGNWAVACEKGVTELNLRKGTVGVADAAFAECAIQSVTLPEGVKYLGLEAFSLCDKLQEVTLGEGLLEIGDRAFYGCKVLSSIHIPESLERIGDNAFQSCKGDIKVYLTDLAAWLGIEFGLNGAKPSGYLYLDGVQITELVIPEGITKINDSAFEGTLGIVSVTIPGTVKIIGNGAFFGCSDLEVLNIGDGVAEIWSSAFWHCENLRTATIPDSVILMKGNSFYGCEKLAQIENGVSYVGKWALDIDPGVTEASLRPDTVGLILTVFTGSERLKLTTLVLPKTVKYVDLVSFEVISDLTCVYYEGSAEEWAGVTVKNGTYENPQGTPVYYYSESTPTDTNNQYWRYVNGVPTKW